MKVFQVCILSLLLNIAVLFPLQVSADEDATKGLYISPTLGLTSFDGELNYEDTSTFSLGLGYQFDNPFAVELVVSNSSTEINNSSSTELDYFQIRVDALYNFTQLKSWVPYLVAGIGDGTIDVGYDKYDQTELNAGVGLTKKLSDNWALRSDVRLFYLYDISFTDTQFNVGINYYFSGSKKPASKKASQKEIQKADKSNTVSNTSSITNKSEGIFLAADYDGDGVSNILDQCKDTPIGVWVNETGCPKDTDMDGVGDYIDRCPQTSKGTKVDNKGCAGDVDSDGVKDSKDKCPNTISGVSVDVNGCRLQITKTIKMSMQLKFKTGQAEILPEHGAEIAKIGTFMKEHSRSTAVIEGHTDSSGSANFNLQLSKYRAEQVRAELIRNYEIDPRRIIAKGYGEERPVADNDTASGRDRNRRIVAIIRAKMDK